MSDYKCKECGHVGVCVSEDTRRLDWLNQRTVAVTIKTPHLVEIKTMKGPDIREAIDTARCASMKEPE